jgi:hypothetical protein
MLNCNESHTPFPPNMYLSPYDCPDVDNVNKELQSQYRSIVGSLMFAAIYWRPDIMFAVSHLSRFLHIPGDKHMKVAVHILKYLKKTTKYGLIFKRNTSINTNIIKPILIASCDSNFGGDKDGINITGYGLQLVDISYLGNNDNESNRQLLKQPEYNLISYTSKRQKHVTDSSTYAEYIAAYTTCKRIMNKTQILNELGFNQDTKLGINLFIDNESVKFIAGSWKSGERSIHMNARYHLVRQMYIKKEIFIINIISENNYTDLFTKPLTIKLHNYQRDKLMCGNTIDEIRNNMQLITLKRKHKELDINIEDID